MNNLKEYTLRTDNFQRPKILKDQDAIYTLLVKLALLVPGTYETHPEMGLGLFENYRYSDDADLIRTNFKKQIQTYLPALNTVEVLTAIKDNHLILQVQIDETVYPISVNTDTNTLEDYV